MTFLHLQICQNRSKEQRTGFPLWEISSRIPLQCVLLANRGGERGVLESNNKGCQPTWEKFKIGERSSFYLQNVFVCLFVENNFTFVILQQQLQPDLIEVSNKKSFFRRGLVQAALCPLHTAVVRSSLGLSLSSFSQHFTTNALVSRFLNVLKIIQGLLLKLSKNICQ